MNKLTTENDGRTAGRRSVKRLVGLIGIHARIKKALAGGRWVRSEAAGRVGPILGFSGNTVKIRLGRETGVTTFESGDPVELIEGRGGEMVVVNTHPNDQVELPPNGGSESKKGVVGG